MNEERILKLKKDFEDASQEKNKIEGQLESANDRLKNECGCKNIKDAEKEINKIEKEIVQLETEIENDLDELEEEINQ